MEEHRKNPVCATCHSQMDPIDARLERCATRKLFTYALGRSPRAFDGARLATLTARFAAGGQRTGDLITDIVHDDAFRTRHGGK